MYNEGLTRAKIQHALGFVGMVVLPLLTLYIGQKTTWTAFVIVFAIEWYVLIEPLRILFAGIHFPSSLPFAVVYGSVIGILAYFLPISNNINFNQLQWRWYLIHEVCLCASMLIMYVFFQKRKRVLFVDVMPQTTTEQRLTEVCWKSISRDGSNGVEVDIERTLEKNDVVLVINRHQPEQSMFLKNERQGLFSLLPLLLLCFSGAIGLPWVRTYWPFSPGWVLLHAAFVMLLWLYVNHFGFETQQTITYDLGSGILFSWLMWQLLPLSATWFAWVVRQNIDFTMKTVFSAWSIAISYFGMLLLSSILQWVCALALGRISASFLFPSLLFPLQLWCFLSQNVAYGMQGWSFQLVTMLLIGAGHQIALVSGFYSHCLQFMIRQCRFSPPIFLQVQGPTPRDTTQKRIALDNLMRIMFDIQILMQETVAESQTYLCLLFAHMLGLLPTDISARYSQVTSGRLWLALGTQLVVRMVTWRLSRWFLMRKTKETMQNLSSVVVLANELPSYLAFLLQKQEHDVVVQRLVQRFREDVPELFWTIRSETNEKHLLMWRNWFPSVLRGRTLFFTSHAVLLLFWVCTTSFGESVLAAFTSHSTKK